jgi:molybdenum cofactor biosynthesis protein MoaC
MIDVSSKFASLRTARACATVAAAPATLTRVAANTLPKPDALIVARCAAIQAAKRTSELIPACHPVPLDFIEVTFALDEAAGTIVITTEVKAIYKTGVEMEALTAAAVAALTIYDMLKPVDNALSIRNITLLEKTGGLHQHEQSAGGPALHATVVVISDSVAAGTRTDESGACAATMLSDMGMTVTGPVVVPDDAAQITAAVLALCNTPCDLVVTCGGTGLGPRDTTAATVRGVIERAAPGISEWLRAYGRERTPRAILSNAVAGVRGRTLIITLPGSPRGVRESLTALSPTLAHAIQMLRGGGHAAA